MSDIVDSDIRMDMLIEAMHSPPVQAKSSKVRGLSDAFLTMIERGSWRPGEKLPPEKDLADQLSLSLGTVQAAMRSLASSGLLERRRGAGTFITNASDLGASVWHFRFRTRDGLSLMPFENRVLTVEETGERGEWSDFLGSGPSYVKIRRIIDIGREFRTYSEVYLDANRFRPLLDLPIDLLSKKNLRIFLHDRYNAPTLRSMHRIKNLPVDESTAALIDCAPGIPCLFMSAFGYTFRDAPVSFQKIVIPPTEYALEILG